MTLFSLIRNTAVSVPTSMLIFGLWRLSPQFTGFCIGIALILAGIYSAIEPEKFAKLYKHYAPFILLGVLLAI